MNDFGEMSHTGAVLSKTEMKELRLKRGECPTCGQKCFNKTLFKSTPISIDGKVLDGRCLTCYPLNPGEVDTFTAEVKVASKRDLSRFSKDWTRHSTGNLIYQPQSRHNVSNQPQSRHNDTDTRRTPKNGSSRKIERMISDGSGIGETPREERYWSLQNVKSGGGGGNAVVQNIENNSKSFGGRGSSASSRSISENQNTSNSNLSKADSIRSSSNDKKGFFARTLSGRRLGSQKSLVSQPTAPETTSIEDDKESQALTLLGKSGNTANFILEVTMDFPQSISIQTKAMSALSDTTCPLSMLEFDEEDNNGLRNMIPHHDYIKAIVKAMEHFPSEEKLQVDACNVLQNLSVSEKMQSTIAREGGINCIIDAMETFPDNIGLQKDAISTLATLGRTSEHQLKMLKRGGDKRIIQTMVKHNESIDLMKLACVAISNLASDDYSLKTGIVQYNGADQIINAMVVFSYDPDFLKSCFCVLRTLSSGHDDNKVRIVNSGAIDSIVSVMELHKNDMMIQEQASYTLRVLGSTPETARTIGEGGGIDVVIRAMWLHVRNLNVKLNCCQTLEILSTSADNASLMIQIGVIAAVVHAMQQASDVSAIQKACCGVLSNLAISSHYAKLRIVEEEGIDAITILMVLHSNNKLVQRKACEVLNNLICDENLDALQAANSLELMNSAAANFPSECNEEAQHMTDILERMQRL
mmetsp:Transcript_8232/g.10453  ORF Transcript_8232/g.10453 Transcript_8232/m.10453 type:complete len:698 (+) Transcript_8232:220-2313(+)